MNLRRTRTVARKEFLHIIRDPRSLAMALAVPLLMLLLFGVALTLDVDRIGTIIYDSDRSAESRELIERFRGSRFFSILASTDTYRDIEESINKDRCLLGIVVPPDYSRKLLAGETVQIQAILDGSDSNTASIALGYTNAVLNAYNQELQRRAANRRAGVVLRPPVDPRLRVWYNSELRSRNYVVPGLIAVIMMIIAALLTSLTIAREWETGTMEQLLSTPLRPSEVVLGKMLAFFALGVVDTLTAVTVGIGVFRVPMRGSFIELAISACIFLVGALCWGILLSAVTRSQLLAFQLGMLSSFLPAFLLSGFVFAIESMPPVVQGVSYLFPTRYFITILKGIFLRGVGLRMLWTEAALLLLFGTLVFLIATRKLKQKVA